VSEQQSSLKPKGLEMSAKNSKRQRHNQIIQKSHLLLTISKSVFFLQEQSNKAKQNNPQTDTRLDQPCFFFISSKVTSEEKSK